MRLTAPTDASCPPSHGPTNERSGSTREPLGQIRAVTHFDVYVRGKISHVHVTGQTSAAIPSCTDLGLPLGRWPAVPSDLRAFANLPDAGVRQKLLADWSTLTDAVRDALGTVPACWLSGSFFTTKERPGDIDCVYLVPHEALATANADPDKARFLQAIVGHGARDNFDLHVDVYFLDWWPRPGTKRGSETRRRGYLEDRGYWDDLWSRSKAGAPHESKVPRRGYLEVTLDGFQ